MAERKTCNQPDRHEPKLKCGHPLPCPWHTIIIDQKSGTITYPDKNIDEKTKERVRNIRDALK